MSILYDVLTVENLKFLSNEQRKEFISEIIITGNYEYFLKFKELLKKDITEIFTATQMLELIPISIDVELFDLVINSYTFPQGQHFFYNFALQSSDMRIREIVYNYFIDNYSHVMVDNMEMYENLIEWNQNAILINKKINPS